LAARHAAYGHTYTHANANIDQYAAAGEAAPLYTHQNAAAAAYSCYGNTLRNDKAAIKDW
jgi:hypothetical protein